MTGLAVTLFLGGWQAPARWLEWLPSWGWFAAKFSALIFLVHLGAGDAAAIAAGSIVEFRLEIPCAAGADQFVRRRRLVESGAWRFPAALEIRWLVGAGLLAVPVCLAGRGTGKARRAEQHHIRYAE